MTKIFTVILISLTLFSSCQDRLSLHSMEFLEEITSQVIDSSRILAGENFPEPLNSFGPNNSGITLIRPGGRDCYPSFWIRDYAMSLESGFITEKEQLDMLLYTSARQSDSSWVSSTGSLIPLGSIPDHIRINDGLPIYFPGTYSFENQGNEMWRLPPYCDQYFFIHMAWYYITMNKEASVLDQVINGKKILTRMDEAFSSVPVDEKTSLVIIDTNFQTCDFGFRDVVTMSGKVCFGSILKYRAAKEMAELLNEKGLLKQADAYNAIAGNISKNLSAEFMDDRGFLLASTGISSQADVWATAFAVYCGALEEPYQSRASKALAKAYEEGSLSREGQVRHVLTTDNYSDESAWEKAAARINRYQNGAYWGTPTGWVCFAVNLSDEELALKLAEEYIEHLRKTDFRINSSTHGGPYECIFPADDYVQNPVYMTSVSVPYAAFKRLGW